jgi:CBS domain-containing protein
MHERTVTAPMTKGVVTVDPEETLAAVAGRMRDLAIKSVVVTDDDARPTGILTSTDYLRLVDEGVDAGSATVGAWMSGDPVVVRYDETVGRAATAMAEAGVGHLPVVDANGRAVGIVSSTDLTEYLARGA